MLKRFLFPTNPNGVFISVILLAVRIVFGILMMNHGIDKWANYQELSTVFPDPLGIGSPLSLGLAIFGELACSMAFIIGFLYRLAMIPMCIDVYYRTGKICRRPLDFPISFSQIEINKALLFYRILFFCSFFNVYVIKMVIFALVYINIEILSQ